MRAPPATYVAPRVTTTPPEVSTVSFTSGSRTRRSASKSPLTAAALLAVWVTAASVSDNAGGIHLLSNIAKAHPRVTKAWADTGYRTKAIDHGARLGIGVEVARRDSGQKGFKVIPRRWVVERTFGWLMKPPTPRPRLRNPPPPFRSHDPHRNETGCASPA